MFQIDHLRSTARFRLPRLSEAVQTTSGRRTFLLFIAIAGVTLATRLPFIGAGYGNDPDSWRVAVAASKIAETGKYTASRPPGFPVHEIGSALVSSWGAVGLNGATAVASAFAVAFFALSARSVGYRNYLLASAMLALAPVVYIASTSTIDYMWALAFIMGSLYFALRGKTLVSGILLGVAVGCRITSLAMLVPIGLLIARSDQAQRSGAFAGLAKFTVATISAGLIVLLPPLIANGVGYLQYDVASNLGSRTPLQVVKTITTGVWGQLGFLGIAVGFVALVMKSSPSRLRVLLDMIRAKPHLLASVAGIAVSGIMFLRLPHEPGYLIPTIPFAILLMLAILGNRAFIVVGAAIAASSFSILGPSGIGPGPLIIDFRSRLIWMQFSDYVLDLESQLPANSIVVAGDWLPKLQGEILQRGETDLPRETVFGLSDGEVYALVDDGYRIYYLPGQKSAFTGAGSRIDGLITPLLSDGIDEAYKLVATGAIDD